MKKIIFIVSIFFLTVASQAQTQFQVAFGGGGDDAASTIIQTTDGGYTVGGLSNRNAGGHFYIVKLNGSGTLQWGETVGGTGNDYGTSIIQTTDGGYAMAGFTFSFGAGGEDFYIVKLDGNGTLQWSRTIGGGNHEAAFSIIQTTDGGFAVAGSTYLSFGAGSNDMFIVKLDASGNLQWSRTFGGTGNEIAYSIIRTTDGGYAVFGTTTSFGAGGLDFYIIKLDASGNLQWSKTVGGAGDEYGTSFIQTTTVATHWRVVLIHLEQGTRITTL